MMEIMKHLVKISTSTIRFSKIVRILHDSNDDSVKVFFQGTETGWIHCSPGDYEKLVQAWSDYLDQTIQIKTEEVTKHVN